MRIQPHSGKRKMATCKHSGLGKKIGLNMTPTAIAVCNAIDTQQPHEIPTDLVCMTCPLYRLDPAKAGWVDRLLAWLG